MYKEDFNPSPNYVLPSYSAFLTILGPFPFVFSITLCFHT